MLVGGSGLYVRAVLDELDFPGTDAAVRARLEAELDAVGAVLAGREVTGRLHAHEAPFGVGYLVADWSVR